MFMKYINEPNMEQLLEVTGEREHLYIAEGQVEGIGQQIAKDMMDHICQNICYLSGQPHNHWSFF